jgi:pimeloyl-ACP methyl ester carboxylesterase
VKSLQNLLRAHPVTQIDTAGGRVQFRQAGNAQLAPTHVLLHGIGSNSASWVWQLQAAAKLGAEQTAVNLLAWDAPGYSSAEPGSDRGKSAPLAPDAPTAQDYAQRLWQWLDAMQAASGQAARPVTLVGHSLGALMAASAARLAPARVARLLLLAPAQGYARASPEERRNKLQNRLDTLAALGPAGLAEKRGPAMLSPQADAALLAFAQSVMAQIIPAGYTQASRMLSEGDLLKDLAVVVCPVAVASGDADTVTPPAGCQAVARHVGAPYTPLPGAGHLCALERPLKVNRLMGLGSPIEPATATGAPHDR